MTDKPIWDKPRPKGLGKSHKLSSSQKASAKAAAKAAGRPWPNLVDNIRAAKSFGGNAYSANNIAYGMNKGGRAGYQFGGVPATNMTAQPNPAAPAANPALSSIGQPPIPPNTNGAMAPSPPPFIPVPNSSGSMNALNAPMNHYGTEAIGYASGGAVEDALRLTRGPHAIRFHQAIARHGYATDGAVEKDNTSVDQPDYEKASKFEQKELEGSAPQYDPHAENVMKKVASNAFKYTPPGAFVNAAGGLDEPSIAQNIREGHYVPAALQAASVALPMAGAATKGAGALYKLGKMDKVGLPSYVGYKTAEDWGPSVVGQQAWNAARDYGSQAADAVRQAVGYADGGNVQQNVDPRRPAVVYQPGGQHTLTPKSKIGPVTPDPRHQISPEEYKKGQINKYEYAMAKGGKVHPDVRNALNLAEREHFRRGGMGYTLPEGVANNAQAMNNYIKNQMEKMTDAQRLAALHIAEAGNQKTDESRALPVINAINRAGAGYNKFKNGQHANPEELSTIKGQIMAPRQFTSFTGQTPKNLQVGVNAIHNVMNNPNHPQVKTGNEIVNKVASGKIPDFTNGSMYYATPGGAGRQFVQNLHRDKNVENFGRAGAHVYAGDKQLSPIAKVNYSNVRDDLQKELEANKAAALAGTTPASTAPAPAAASASSLPSVVSQKPISESQPVAQGAPSAPAPQGSFGIQPMTDKQEQQPAAPMPPPRPADLGMKPPPAGSVLNDINPKDPSGPLLSANKPAEPMGMANKSDEPIAKPINPQGPEAPEAPAQQAQAPKLETPEPVEAKAETPEPQAPETPEPAMAGMPDDGNMDMAGDMPNFDMAANGGKISRKETIDRGLKIARKYANTGGSYGQDGNLRLHQRVARNGYATDGSVKGNVEIAPETDSEKRKSFLQENLKGSAPQYDPEGGVETAKEAGRMVAGMTTPGAIADAAGYLGGPSALENVRNGNYGTAALQAAGAIPLAGPIAKGALGAGLLYKAAKATAPEVRAMMDPAVVRSIGGGDKAVEDALRVAKEAPIIKAYHGSPHKFDRFDIGKIGTGEGAQAYGHGLYFADNEDVARGYRDQLSYQNKMLDGKKFYGSESHAHSLLSDAMDAGGGIDDALRLANEQVADFSKGPNKSLSRANIAREALATLQDWKARNAANFDKGFMYEVNLHANPEHMLDWDKPLHLQQEIAPSVRDMAHDLKLNADYWHSDPEYLKRVNKTGQDFYESLVHRFKDKRNKLGNPSEASSELKYWGIPGIKYLDAGSRGAGEGSNNYVVFDPKLIDIMRRYAQGGEVDGALCLAKGGGAWTRAEGKDPAGGLNSKGRASLKAQGHDIKPPAPHPKNEKDAGRRKSFCARMSGMQGPMKDEKGRPTRKALSLKAWNC